MANAGELESNWKGIPIPFAKNATYGGGNSSLPLDEIAGSNKASWNKGFPETTFQPNNAPSGGDFNTLPNIITGLLMNLQLGQAVNSYSAEYQTSQGGYPKGALIWANTTPNDYATRSLFMSLIDNNTYNPTNVTYWKKLLPVEIPAQRNYLPDYSRAVYLGGQWMPYQFGEDGWVIAENSAGFWAGFIGINGLSFASGWARGDDYTSPNTICCMVSAGDRLTMTDRGGKQYSRVIGRGYFVPFKS